jgi:murein DD-endopeptidase MepM/ murein hydrolase activator NlpD
VSRRHLVSTATVVAFAFGFGAGVLGAWLLETPSDADPRAALATLDRAYHAGPERAREPVPGGPPTIAPDAGVTAPPSALRPRPASPDGGRIEPALSPALASGLSREAELAGQARLAKAALPVPQRLTEQVTVRRGDTLIDILNRAGIAQAEAHAAVQSLRKVYDPRRLRAGQELLIRAEDERGGAGARRLIGLAFDLDFDHAVRVTRDTDGRYVSAKVARPQRRDLVHRTGIIDDSLYVSAERAALPHDVIINLIKLFSWDVDFQRDVRRGDQFETLFEVVSLEDGSADMRGGDLVYAALSIDGRLLEGYRFELPDGRVAYFDRSGKSLRKFLLRTPIDGARLSSGFGMRRHPILGYTLMHKGVDFAAPTGTPVYAAGEGRIELAKRNGGYGKYVRIRHTGDYSTAYAHLSAFAKGIAPGRRVRQGQVIGYVGTTGRSTGPHLHYEVLRNNAQINPLRLKQPPNQQLAGADLKRFQAEIERIDRLRADPPRGTQLASRGQ